MSNGHEGEEIYNSKCYKELERLSLLCSNVEFYAIVNIWDDNGDLFEVYEGYKNIPHINEEFYSLFEFYFINGEEHDVNEK